MTLSLATVLAIADDAEAKADQALRRSMIPGKDGKNGRDGRDGVDGEKGDRGRDGLDGKDGKDGKDGSHGRDGLNGLDGKDGRDGKDGETGRDGIDGRDGLKGLPGRDGIDGNDGTSVRWRGTWSTDEEYDVGDLARYRAAVYVATQKTSGRHPPSEAWDLFLKDGNGQGAILGQRVSWLNGDAANGGSNVTITAGAGITVTRNGSNYIVAITGSFAASLSGGSVNRVGTTVTPVPLVWSYNDTITAQTLSGTGSSQPVLTDRAQTIGTSITTDTTYTLNATASSGQTASATASVLFQYDRFWGVSALTSLNNAQILALSNELSTSRQQSRVMTPSAQFMYFVFPTSFGTPTFTSNGFNDTDWVKVSTLASFVNSAGATVSMDVWRSSIAGIPVTGTFTEVVL